MPGPARKKNKKRRSKKTAHANALRKAAAAFVHARSKRDVARKKLASLSRPGDPHHIVDPSAAWMEKALSKARKRLLGIEGVVGVGLGNRVRKGVQTDEPCISVLVSEKIPMEKVHERNLRAIPKLTRVGKRTLAIDVVELGRLQRQVFVGADIGPAQDLHAGTLGVFARDIADDSACAVTAMHVSGLAEVPNGSVASVPFSAPSRLAGNHGPLFADLVLGTMSRIDAAKLRLHMPRPPGGTIPGFGEIAGWRPLTFPGDLRTTVFMFGAVSELQQGFIANTSIDLPGEGLESAVLVNIKSTDGDSGSAMVDSQGFVLGFLVGAGDTQLGNLRVFCPVGLVFSELGCDIP
jgi:hypothetical protein